MSSATTEKPRAAEERSFTNLAWLLARASHVITTELTQAFEDIGIAPRAQCVLQAAQAGEHTQKELAEMIGLDKTTMVVTIDELERKGLAERRQSKTDRRARIIGVTPKGRRVLAKGEEVVDAIQRDVLAALPAAERKAFVAALEHLVEGRLATPAECVRAPRRRT